VPLFQEQLLRIAMAVAGFSAGEAEELRRAMGFKRSIERMNKIEQRLRAGMGQKGIQGVVADRIVRSIMSFALYGFPESHAASFALIAYASAYLKCHHPAAFLTAMLNCFPLGFYHPATLVKDAQRHGVKVMPIDVTRSDWKCTLEEDQDCNSHNRPLLNLNSPLAQQSLSGAESRPLVRLGLKYVNGLREETGLHAESERRRHPFFSMADFAARVAPNKRELAAIAYSGGFAAFGMTRREALWQAAAIERDPDSLLARVGHSTESPEVGGNFQLPGMTDVEETLADYSATSITIGPHVMAHLRQSLKLRDILSAAELAEAVNGAWAKAAGVVIVRQRPGTAKGLLFLTLEDETGIANAMVTPELFHANRGLLHRAQMLIVEGPLQKHEGVIHVIGRRFTELKLGGPMPKSHDFH
jgi:error-prone DNA polymerase